jgi:hypothetical protein
VGKKTAKEKSLAQVRETQKTAAGVVPPRALGWWILSRLLVLALRRFVWVKSKVKPRCRS